MSVSEQFEQLEFDFARDDPRRVAILSCALIVKELLQHLKSGERERVSVGVNRLRQKAKSIPLLDGSLRPLDAPAYMLMHEIVAMTGRGRNTIKRWYLNKKFPQPLKVAPTLHVFDRDQVIEWIDTHPDKIKK